MSSQGFPRTARLLRPDEFAAAMKGRRIGRTDHLALQAGPAGPSGVARLGLVVGKRSAPLSVTRAAIKRVVREAFRLQCAALPAADYVVRLHRRVDPVSLTVLKRQIRAEIDALFARARKSPRPPSVPPEPS